MAHPVLKLFQNKYHLWLRLLPTSVRSRVGVVLKVLLHLPLLLEQPPQPVPHLGIVAARRRGLVLLVAAAAAQFLLGRVVIHARHGALLSSTSPRPCTTSPRPTSICPLIAAFIIALIIFVGIFAILVFLVHTAILALPAMLSLLGGRLLRCDSLRVRGPGCGRCPTGDGLGTADHSQVRCLAHAIHRGCGGEALLDVDGDCLVALLLSFPGECSTVPFLILICVMAF